MNLKEKLESAEAEIARLEGNIRIQQKQIERLFDQRNIHQAALEFYANEINWLAPGHPQMDADLIPVIQDGGAKARAAFPQESLPEACDGTTKPIGKIVFPWDGV